MKDDTAFYNEEEMERLWVRGILGGVGKKSPLTQDELVRLGNNSIDKIGTGLSDTERRSLQGVIKSTKGEKFAHWYEKHGPGHVPTITVPHTDKLASGKYFDCDMLADEWYKWFLTTPKSKNPYSNPGTKAGDGSQSYGGDNVFLMQKRDTRVYFTTAAPFQEPDLKVITLTTEGHLLVPAYNIFASEEVFPSLDDEKKLQLEMVSDLFGIKIDEVNAEFDGQSIHPCCVFRRKPLKISGIPIDNVYGIPQDRFKDGSSINILHEGFWILIKQEALTPGDHLLEWKVASVNYKMNAYLLINALV